MKIDRGRIKDDEILADKAKDYDILVDPIWKTQSEEVRQEVIRGVQANIIIDAAANIYTHIDFGCAMAHVRRLAMSESHSNSGQGLGYNKAFERICPPSASSKKYKDRRKYSIHLYEANYELLIKWWEGLKDETRANLTHPKVIYKKYEKWLDDPDLAEKKPKSLPKISLDIETVEGREATANTMIDQVTIDPLLDMIDEHILVCAPVYHESNHCTLEDRLEKLRNIRWTANWAINKLRERIAKAAGEDDWEEEEEPDENGDYSEEEDTKEPEQSQLLLTHTKEKNDPS